MRQKYTQRQFYYGNVSDNLYNYIYMCFSFRVSIITFLFTWISSLYLLTKNLKKKESQSIILLMMFGSMKLID